MDYFQRFVKLKAKAPNVPEDVAIEATIKSLRSTVGQTMTSEEGWKSKIRTSSTKQVAGMFRRATEAKANCSLCRPLINKFLT